MAFFLSRIVEIAIISDRTDGYLQVIQVVIN